MAPRHQQWRKDEQGGSAIYPTHVRVRVRVRVEVIVVVIDVVAVVVIVDWVGEGELGRGGVGLRGR